MIEKIGLEIIALIIPAFVIAVWIPFFFTLFAILKERNLTKNEKQSCWVTVCALPLSLFNAICCSIIHWPYK